MSGHPRIVGAVLLAIMTSLPIAGSLCAVLCGTTASQPARHHHDGMSAQRSHDEDLQITPTSDHDCTSHVRILRPALATERFDRIAAFSWPAALPSRIMSSAAALIASPSMASSPRERTLTHAASPLVLRV